MMYINEYPDLLKVTDVMKIMRVGRKTVYAYIESGVLSAKMLAGKYIIFKKSVQKLIDEIDGTACYNQNNDNSGAPLTNFKEC